MTTDAPDGVMVFDGICVFCSSGVRLLLALDRRQAIRFTPIQSPYGSSLAESAGMDAANPATFLFFDNGRPLEKSAAVLAMVRRLPRPWCWAAVVGRLPASLLNRVYDWVARHRYRLFGRRRACLTPTPEHRARFVTELLQ